jgi:hypothetical protein
VLPDPHTVANGAEVVPAARHVQRQQLRPARVALSGNGPRRVRAGTDSHEIRQVPLTHLERILPQRAAKQFVPQPHLVGVDYVGLAVVRDLFDLAFVEVALHLSSVESFRLSSQSHDSAIS